MPITTDMGKKRVCLGLIFLFSAVSVFGKNLLELVPNEAFFDYHVNLSKILKNYPNFSKKVPNLQIFADQVTKLENHLPPNMVPTIASPTLVFFTLAKASNLHQCLSRMSFLIFERIFHFAEQSSDSQKCGTNDDFIQNTGIDPLKHVSHILVFVWGDMDKMYQEGGVLFDGTFDLPRMLEVVKENEAVARKVLIDRSEGFDLVKGKSYLDGIGVALDGATIGIGTNEAMEHVIAVKTGKGKGICSNEIFTSLLKKIDTDACLWGAGIISQFHKDQMLSSRVFNSLATFNTVYFSFNFDGDLDFFLGGEIDKMESMEKVFIVANGVLAGLKMMFSKSLEFNEALEMIKLESAGADVKISLRMTKAKIDELRIRWEKRMKSENGSMGLASTTESHPPNQ